MKKFLLFVVITIVAVFLAILFAINLPNFNSSGTFVELPLFEYNQGYIDIDGIRYIPNQFDWKVDQRGERIGYLKDDNGTLSQHFYQRFYHGLYEIKDESTEKFYQPHAMFADVEYRLLVSEKLNLGYPTLATCRGIQSPLGVLITDPEIIKEFFHYTDNATSSVSALLPADIYTIRVFHNQYSRIYNEAYLYKSQKDGTYALKNFDQSLDGFIQVPQEFVTKMGFNTD